MPPTFSRGKIVIAITTIPIPPNHCIIALHSKILLGLLSKSEIIVAPVVVIPDILSKNASLKVNSLDESKKGKLPKMATINHARVENKNVCLKFSLNSFSKLAKTNNIPIKIVTKEDEMPDIKKKYFELAKKFHPDMNPDNDRAEEEFLKI